MLLRRQVNGTVRIRSRLERTLLQVFRKLMAAARRQFNRRPSPAGRRANILILDYYDGDSTTNFIHSDYSAIEARVVAACLCKSEDADKVWHWVRHSNGQDYSAGVCGDPIDSTSISRHTGSFTGRTCKTEVPQHGLYPYKGCSAPLTNKLK